MAKSKFHASSEQRTLAEDVKKRAKKCTSLHKESMRTKRGGPATSALSSMDQRSASILGQSALCGIVDDHEEDTHGTWMDVLLRWLH